MAKRKVEYIYWFAYYNLDSSSVRYRAKFPLEFASTELGVSSILVIPGYSVSNLYLFFKAFLSALFFPRRNSIIVLQRLRSSFIYANLLKLLVLLRKEKSVYDLDDADYLVHKPETIHFFARNCQYISAGSPVIMDYLKQYNDRVFHLTSPTPDFRITKQNRNKVFKVGWIGDFGGGHKDGLYKYLFPALKKIKFDFQLEIVGITKLSDEKEVRSYFKNQNNITISIPKNINWHDEVEVQNIIKHFDVGIATLMDQPIQLAKSGIKAKQYLNNGVPVICNDLPENNKVVIDGYNGFVCKTEIDFATRLNDIANMEEEFYWQLSKNARKSTKNFNHQNFFREFGKMTNREFPLESALE